jgi:uncharacterized protein YndB with AHSA1/START domain
MANPINRTAFFTDSQRQEILSQLPSAPIRSMAETTIVAPINRVWKILTDFNTWPDWNPEVTSVAVDGELEPGSSFQWKTGPGTIHSTLSSVEPPGMISWQGKTFGINAYHVWQLSETDEGTLVKTAESWDGWLPGLFRKYLQKTLQASLDRGLDYLRISAEEEGTKHE